MKRIRRPTCTRWIAAMLCALAAVGEGAHADDLSGVFMSANGGLGTIATDNALYQDQLVNQTASIGTLGFNSASLKNRKPAEWLDVGFMVWPYVGIDVAYLHLGELVNQATGTFTASAGGTQSVGATTRIRSAGPAAGLLVRLPLLERLEAHLRVADYCARTTVMNILNARTYTSMERGANGSSLLLALGAAYALGEHWSVQIDYLRINKAGDSTKVVDYDANLATLGVSLSF